jgi:alcohol dehydrogenase (cytochrome c)
MARGNYQSWSYSRLPKSLPKTVKRLRLGWVWAMNDGGANRAAPIVHDGIIYLTNTSNTLQALEWPHRRPDLGESDWSRIHARVRRHAHLAIYDDKLLLTTRMPACTRSMPAPAKSSGRPPSRQTSRATATPPERSSSTARC